MNIDSIVSTTEDLIRFRSTADRELEREKCADYVADFFSETSLQVEKIVQNGVTNIVVTKGTKTPTVFLSAHIDVVEGLDEQFEPYQKEGRLYGRGAMDMKSGAAALMHLMRELADTDHDVGFIATGDEEIGGFNGLGYLLEQGYRSKVIILPDGGDVVNRIISKEKGLLRLKLKVTGKAAHGSRTWLGVSANEILLDTLQKIRSLFVPTAEHPDDHWVPTCNIGEIKGGTVWNAVSDWAEADCDIRTTETEGENEIIPKIKELLPEEVSMEVQNLSEGFNLPKENPLVAQYLDAIKEHGRDPEFFETFGRSDACFLTPYNIVGLMSQPDGLNYHAPNESVDIESIGLYYNVVKSYLDKVALN